MKVYLYNSASGMYCKPGKEYPFKGGGVHPIKPKEPDWDRYKAICCIESYSGSEYSKLVLLDKNDEYVDLKDDLYSPAKRCIDTKYLNNLAA